MTGLLLLLPLSLGSVQDAGAGLGPAPLPSVPSGGEQGPSAPPHDTEPSRPIRTNEPGTGIFIGSGVLGRLLYDRRSAPGERLETWTAVGDLRYTPSTHWVFGARLPFVLNRRLEGPPTGAVSTRGPGDLSLSAKHRFFRRVGRWSDRHAAAEVEIELPTGVADAEVDPGLPSVRRRQLQPGSGSVDVVLDLIYQEGRQRFVYGGDLGLRLNSRGEAEYRFGHEAWLNLDLEYILLPLEYRRPGHEVFVLLETTLRRKWADDDEGTSRGTTALTEVLLAPAIQYIATERLLLGLSVQLPALSRATEPEAAVGEGGRPPEDGLAGPDTPRGLEHGLNVLVELRYAP